MKRKNTLVAVWVLLIAGACGSESTPPCAKSETCPPGVGGSGGNPFLDCALSVIEGEPPPDMCEGIFVSSSSTASTEDGSREAPFKTFAAAAAQAAVDNLSIYLCGETITETETVQLTNGAKAVGGFDCANDWTFVPTAITQVNGVSPAIRLLNGDFETGVGNLHITAAAGSVAEVNSIAVVADQTKATFVNCTLEALDAANGADGAATPAAFLTPAPMGNPGGEACSVVGTVVGGSFKANPDCMSTGGGSGGNGVSNGNGGNGANGQPGAVMGGLGEGEPTAATACTQGGNGLPGTNSSDTPASATLGTLSANGYAPPSPEDGIAGTPGQGGGGGGGSKGGLCTSPNAAGAGASGGSGGPGGCGGVGGRGGLGGGSSIALVSVESSITLTSCTLKSGKGGDGGMGQGGQPGQEGGDGGMGGSRDPAPLTKSGCDGGNGGQGGNGSAGAGGPGGHSLAIAYTGTAPSFPMATIELGAAGTGGTSSGNAGAMGVAANSQKFE